MNSFVPHSLAEVLRDEMLARDRVKAILQNGRKTIPETAEALAAPTREVTLWVMAMCRYGVLTEVPKSRADDYFRYSLLP